MAHHSVFPKQLGQVHEKNRTPYVAISSYILLILAIPCVLEIFTNPLTTFGDGGTLAAFGFLTAYYLITIAAPVYLKKRGELKPNNVVVAVIACLALAVPTIGSFVPVPPFPVRIFPYIFLTWVLVGGSWLYALNRRKGQIFSEIEVDLETSMQASVRSHNEDMGKVFDVNNGNGNRPVPPTFEELELALTGAA
jgi:amino acid transporter